MILIAALFHLAAQMRTQPSIEAAQDVAPR